MLLITDVGRGGSGSVVWFCCRCSKVSHVVGGMVSIGLGSSGGGRGNFVQAGDGIVWSGEIPFVVVARLTFRSFCFMYAACFLWYSSSASGLVASDVLPEDLCSDFVSTWCLLFRLRSATSRQLVFVLLIQASRLFQKMTRASLAGIPENVVFFRIPVQIHGSKS